MNKPKIIIPISILLIFHLNIFSQDYPIVDTNVKDFYSNNEIIEAPEIGEAFYGQDATYTGNKPSYTKNGDGTITDNVTGLMWEQSMGNKLTFDAAFDKAETSTLAGYSDWRVPNIKEIYSLIQFTGVVKGETAVSFFIDTNYFDQPLGDVSIGEREIDAQTWSSTEYVGYTMGGDATVFGVNFIDGRIKGYPKYLKLSGEPNTMYFRLVRNNIAYGKNKFIDNKDGTISDLATGLMWQTADDGNTRDWKQALAYAEDMELAGHDDWRLPNAKELQSIVDYTRSPQTTNSPAIDPIFKTTEISDPEGNTGQYPFFWTSTSHLDGANPYSSGVYIAFGEGMGQMNGKLMDVHGAGCQRSDPKSGNADDYPQYWGPQGDVRYVYNYVRCVRSIDGTSSQIEHQQLNINLYPNPANNEITIDSDDEICYLQIFDSFGKLKLKQDVKSKKTTLTTNNFCKGLYIIKLTNYSGKSLTKKIVINTID